MRIDFPSILGLSQQADPLRLPDGMCTFVRNSRPNNGNLRPMALRSTVATVPVGRRSLHRMRHSGGTGTAWLSWTNDLVHAITGFDREDSQSRLYFTGATGGPQWTDQTLAIGTPPYPTASRPLAVNAPINAPLLTVTDAGTAANDETRYYVTTFVNDLGWESAPSPPAMIVCKTDAKVRIHGLENAPSGQSINRRRIYRTKTGASSATEFFFLKELVYASGGQEWTEDTTVLSNDVLVTAGSTTLGAWLPCPSDARFLTKLWNGMAAVITGKSVRACVANTLYAWPLDQEIVLADEPVGQATWGQNLLVLTKGNVPSIITGQDPLSLSEQPLEGLPFNGACVSPHSILSVGHGVVWAGPDGLCYYGSMGAKLLTAGIFEPDEWRRLGPENFHAGQFEGMVLMASTTMLARETPTTDVTGKLGLLIDPGATPAGAFFIDVDGDVLHKDPVTSELFCLDSTTGNITELQRNVGNAYGAAVAYSKEYRTPSVNLGYCRVLSQHYPVIVMLIGDGAVVDTITVTDDDVWNLVSGFECQRWQIRVEVAPTTADRPPQVTSVHLADDPMELLP
jgi:hypothetical protein